MTITDFHAKYLAHELTKRCASDSLFAHNTFDAPERVKPGPFDGAKLSDGKLTVELPAHAVVVLTLK